MNTFTGLFAQKFSLFHRMFVLPVLFFLAAMSSSCQIPVAHQTDEQMLNSFTENEQEFSKLAKMSEEDQELWRVTIGDTSSSNKFEIYSPNNFRPATFEEITLERRKEYAELMKKTGVSVLLKEDVSKNQLGIFLSNTKRNFSQNHNSEKGFLYTRSRIAENIFKSLDDKNQNESYRPPILDFRAVKQDWFLYYRSE